MPAPAPWRKHQLHDRSLTQQAAGLVEPLVKELQIPDAWKEEVIQQVQMFRRLAEHRPARFIAEEEPDQ